MHLCVDERESSDTFGVTESEGSREESSEAVPYKLQRPIGEPEGVQDLNEVSNRLSERLVAKYNQTMDTVDRTKQMVMQAQQAAESAAVTLAAIQDVGVRGYAEQLLTPLLVQIQDGTFYSEPSCEMLSAEQMKAFQVAPILGLRYQSTVRPV